MNYRKHTTEYSIAMASSEQSRPTWYSWIHNHRPADLHFLVSIFSVVLPDLSIFPETTPAFSLANITNLSGHTRGKTQGVPLVSYRSAWPVPVCSPSWLPTIAPWGPPLSCDLTSWKPRIDQYPIPMSHQSPKSWHPALKFCIPLDDTQLESIHHLEGYYQWQWFLRIDLLVVISLDCKCRFSRIVALRPCNSEGELWWSKKWIEGWSVAW